MAMGVHAAAERHKGKLITFLTVTWILGAAFLGIKAVEWSHDYHIGLIPALNWSWYDTHPVEPELLKAGIGPQQVLMYFVIYFSMTGLHAIHMIVGLGLVGWFIVLAARGQIGRAHV